MGSPYLTRDEVGGILGKAQSIKKVKVGSTTIVSYLNFILFFRYDLNQIYFALFHIHIFRESGIKDRSTLSSKVCSRMGGKLGELAAWVV